MPVGPHSIGNLGGPGPVRTLALAGGVIALAGVGILAAAGTFSKDPNAAANGCVQAKVLVPNGFGQFVRDRAAGIAGSAGCAPIVVTEGTPTSLRQDAYSGAELPDAWITDSPVWVGYAASALKARGTSATTGDVFATSPVVFAVPAGIVNQLNTGVRGWLTLLAAAPLNSAVPTENTSAALSFTTIWQHLHSNRLGSSALGDAFFKITRDPKTQAALLGQTGKDAKAFPASEQEIYAHNAQAADDARLRALVPSEGPPEMQYSLNIIGEPGGEKKALLNSLSQALTDDSGKQALLDAGFRVDGKRTRAVDDIPEQLPGKAPAMDQKQFDSIMSEWSCVTRDLRMTMVVDVSGSMLEQTGETRRIDLAVTAVQQAVRLMKPTSSAGLWVFSSAQEGNQDFRTLSPVADLGEVSDAKSHGAALLNAAATIPSYVGGNTGLNDTLYAAYVNAQENYQKDRDNLVVLLTDGRNEDTTGGMSTDQLIAKLRAQAKPDKPVRIVVVGLGSAADQAVMSRVTSQVDGWAYYVSDPAEIPAAFSSAIWSHGSYHTHDHDHDGDHDHDHAGEHGHEGESGHSH